jgi:hypothetical protein
MDGEQNGTQESTQAQEEQVDTTAQQAASLQVGNWGNEDGNAAAPDYEKQIAEQAEKLSVEIAELKQASADERVDFALQLAGVPHFVSPTASAPPPSASRPG